eukprot:304094-Chlamydomonas_euryale.AAC.2
MWTHPPVCSKTPLRLSDFETAADLFPAPAGLPPLGCDACLLSPQPMATLERPPRLWAANIVSHTKASKHADTVWKHAAHYAASKFVDG